MCQARNSPQGLFHVRAHCIARLARRITRCAPCGRYAQTICAKSEHEARCARGPSALRSSAPHRRAASCPGPALPQRSWCLGENKPPCFASGGTRQGRFLRRRGAQHQGRRAFSALRPHACRICLSAARKRVASYAARPWGEHRSAVGPQGRPPQHEPLAGAARRDAPNGTGKRPLANSRYAPQPAAYFNAIACNCE